MDALAGDTVIEDKTGGVTVNVVVPLIEPDAAWIVALPVPTPVAAPEALMVAAAVFNELQVADEVKFCVLPSVKVPVARNCC